MTLKIDSLDKTAKIVNVRRNSKCANNGNWTRNSHPVFCFEFDFSLLLPFTFLRCRSTLSNTNFLLLLNWIAECRSIRWCFFFFLSFCCRNEFNDESQRHEQIYKHLNSSFLLFALYCSQANKREFINNEHRVLILTFKLFNNSSKSNEISPGTK